MIRALIFDCFGVLYRDNIYLIYDTVPADKRQQMHDIIRACDYGMLSRTDYFTQIGELSGLGEQKIREIEKEQFVRNQQLIDRLPSYRQSYKVGMLSNIGDETMERLFPSGELHQLFDAYVLSGEVGMTKPSPEIFELMATRLGLLPEECLMIDDLPKNAEGARRAGMQTIVFASNQQFEAELERVLGSNA